MLNEASRRLKRGKDIVVGYVESHQRLETLLRGSTVSRLLKKTKNIAVYIVPNDR